MTTCVGKSFSFGLLCVSFVGVCQILCVSLFPLLVLRVDMGCDCIIYYSKFAKDRYHINPIQKKFENMYLIIDSSDIDSVFSIQLQNE